MKNQLHYSFLLCLSLVAVLWLLHYPPEISVGSIHFRKIDLLADIKTDVAEHQTDSLSAEIITDSTSVAEPLKMDSTITQRLRSCPNGITCIEDYSADSTALKTFIKALQATARTHENVRIAFYGDSFIEGDVFCGSFRDSLQSAFGGRGVGLVPITSAVAGFRNTIKHSFSNWQTISVMQKEPAVPVGVSGYSFIPLEGNGVEYKPAKQRYLREFNDVKLYYRTNRDAILHYIVDTLEASDALTANDVLQEWNYKGKNIQRVQFEFFPFEGVEVYGASFENGAGVYVDNFSIRGNTGMNLPQIPRQMFQQFDQYRDYKLVILQFGLNMVVEDRTDFSAYTQRMVGVVNYLKSCLPNSSFLLLSVSDRSNNTTGKFETMKAIPALVEAQRQIAKKTGIGFWDLYQAMGGKDSMVKFTEATPPLGARDYTHLTFRGGKVLAGSLVKSILAEKQRYEKKGKNGV